MPSLSPRFAAALVVTAVIVALAVRFYSERVVSASELLRNATEAQAIQVSKTTQAVIHQQLQVRRKGGAASGADSVNWEIWNDATSSRFQQSVAQNGGRRFISTSASTERCDQEPSFAPPILRELEQVLRDNHMDPHRPLSPSSFKEWRESLEQKREEVTKSQLVGGVEALTLRTISASQIGVGQIAEATLVVRARDWQPGELRLKIRAADGDLEYEVVQTAFQVVSLTVLSSEIFPEQARQSASIPTSNVMPAASPSTSLALKANPLPLVAPPARALATAELEVDVLRLLNQAGADLGEQVSANRNSEGLLRVDGIVETDDRKSEILRALEPVINNAAVRVDIKTVAEAVADKRQREGDASRSAKEQRVEIQSGAMATEYELRSYFGSEEKARQFAARMVSRSQRSMRRLFALKRLANQFSAEELRALNLEARAKWLLLVRSHARAYQQDIGALRQELRPVFFPSAPQSGAAEGPEISDMSGFVQAINQLFDLGSANDHVILSAFTTSAEGSTITALKTTQFWQSLQVADVIASRIQAAQ